MKQPTIAALAATLSFLPAAQAELHDRGNGLIYDDVLDITWLQDANLFKTLCDAGDPLATDFDPLGAATASDLCNNNGRMGQGEAERWVEHLNANSYLGYQDWRQWEVPTPSDDPGCSLQDTDADGTDYGHNCSASEMGNLFNVTLSNPKYGSGGCPPDCLPDSGPFINIQQGEPYWSGTLFKQVGNWSFSFPTRYQLPGVYYFVPPLFHVWAVRPGDVAAAPVPTLGAWGLGSLGLLLVALVWRPLRRISRY